MPLFGQIDIKKLETNHDIRGLIKLLNPKNANLFEAIRALSRLKAVEAVEPLAMVLKKDEDWTHRRDVAEALGEIGNDSAVEPLIEALTSRPKVEPLTEAQKNQHQMVQKYIAEALGKIGNPIAVKPLIAALEMDYPDPPRSSIRDALIKIGLPAVEALAATTQSPSIRVCQEAIYALGEIGDASAIPCLNRIFRTYIMDFKNEAEIRKHMDSGESLVSTEGLPALPKKNLMTTINLRSAAADALAKIGAPAIEVLLLALQENGFVKQKATNALLKIGIPAKEALEAAMNNPDEKVRIVANEVLKEF
jgi:HEAT repeat protein